MSNEIGINLRVNADSSGVKSAGQEIEQLADKTRDFISGADPEKARQFWAEYNAGLNSAVRSGENLSRLQTVQGFSAGGGGTRPLPLGGTGTYGDKMRAIAGMADPEQAEEFWENFSEGMEEFLENIDGALDRRFGPGTGGAGGGMGGGGGAVPPVGPPSNDDGGGKKRPGNIIDFPIKKLMGGAQSQIGAVSNDAVGGITNMSGDALQGIAKILPPQVAVALAAIIGTIATGNYLSKQYEALVPGTMEATGALGRYKGTASEQSLAFRTTLDEIGKKAIPLGYKPEEGLSLLTDLMRSGTNANDGISGVGDIMGFSRGYGLQSPSKAFSSLYAMSSLYKEELTRPTRLMVNGQWTAPQVMSPWEANDALEYAAGGAKKTIGDARVEEYAEAMQTMFEDGLSEGVIKGFGEISRAQNFLYSAFGDKAGGSRGASLYGQMSSAVRGATGLQSETDLMMYRAARGLSSNPGETYVDTFARMEQGFSPELFKKYREQISGASYTEQVEMIKKAFGLSSYQQAIDLYNANTDESMWGAVKGKAPGSEMAKTNEVSLIAAQNSIKDAVTDVGAKVLGTKEGIVGAVDKVFGFLTGRDKAAPLPGANPPSPQAGMTNKEYQEYGQGQFAGMPESMKKAMAEAQKKRGMNGLDQLIFNSDWANMPDATKKRLVEIDNQSKGTWNAQELEALRKALEELRAAVNGNTQAAKTPGKVSVQGQPAPATGSRGTAGGVR